MLPALGRSGGPARGTHPSPPPEPGRL